MPHIAILMSSASQAAEPALQTTRASETIVIKTQVLSLINEFLRQDFSAVGGEALRAVIHLVVIEVKMLCLSERESVDFDSGGGVQHPAYGRI